MLGSHKVDIVHAAQVLQLYKPLRKLLGGKIESVLLVGDVMVLTADAAKTAAREEDRARAIVSLKERLFACRLSILITKVAQRGLTKVWGDSVDGSVGANEAISTSLKSVDIALPWTEVASA